MSVRLFLAGEGRNELGSRAGHPSFQSDEARGVLQALVDQVQPKGVRVVGAIQWKDLRKLRARGPSPDEAEQIARLLLHAEEAEANAVVFSRDGDDDADARRRSMEEGVAKGMALLKRPLSVAGEVAVPCLEGWILAVQGIAGTEGMTRGKVQQNLVDLGIPEKDTEGMVRLVDAHGIEKVPSDARGLLRWVGRARAALGVQVFEAPPAP